MADRREREVRYVKCPKCARTLKEPDHVPLYICGGCNTVLQAKYYRKPKEASVPTLPTNDDVQSNGKGNDNGNGNARHVENSGGSSRRSSGEQSTTQNEEKNEKADDNYNSEQIGDRISGSHASPPEESSALEIRDSKQELVTLEESGETSDEYKAEQLPMENGTKEGGSDQDQLPMENGTKEGGSDQDQYITCETSTRREIEVPENTKLRQLTAMVDEVIPDENDRQEQCEDIVLDIALDNEKEVEQENFTKEASIPVQSQTNEEPTQVESVIVAEGNRVSGNEIDYVADEKPVAVEKLAEEDTSGKERKSFMERIREKLTNVTISNDSPMQNSLPEAEASIGASASRDFNPLSDNERIVSGVLEDPDDEKSLLDLVIETSSKQIENFDDSVSNGSGQNIKVETSELVETHEKVGSMFEEVPRSPTKRSPVYDGSISSCDGNDDRTPGQPEQINGGSFSENEIVAGNVDDSLKTIKPGNSRTQPQVKSSFDQLKPSMVEDQEPARENGNPEDNRTRRPHRDTLIPPRIPSDRRTSEVAFETGSSSRFVYDDGPSHGTRHSQYGYEDQKPFRRKTYSQWGYFDGKRFSEDGYRRQNDLVPPTGEIFPKETYYGYPNIGRREGRSFSGNISQPRYSGEMYNGRYQVHDHHMHRHPRPRPWSSQLPSRPPRAPPAGYYRHRPISYMDPPVETAWDSYAPYPLNPQRFSDLEPYGWVDDQVYLSDDQRYHDSNTKKSYMREKRYTMKRHLRPMSGGAPFVTCRFCSKLLQLPEEFLLSKTRKIHRLKCGACSYILEFSLGNELSLTSRLPYTGESVETNLDRDVSSHDSQEAHKNEKNMLQHSSFGALGRERPNEVNDATSASNQSRQVKVTWQMPSRRKSPLHQLMGYSSPHDLLGEQTLDDEE